MDVKEQTRKAYELFGKGDMETFFNEMIDDKPSLQSSPVSCIFSLHSNLMITK